MFDIYVFITKSLSNAICCALWRQTLSYSREKDKNVSTIISVFQSVSYIEIER